MKLVYIILLVKLVKKYYLEKLKNLSTFRIEVIPIETVLIDTQNRNC